MEESVKSCYHCGRLTFNPYFCRECSNWFCEEHRLLEQHNCPSLNINRVTRPRKKINWVAKIIGLVLIIITAAAALYLLDLYGFLSLEELFGLIRKLLS
jgi:uncharacterized membrane protein YvbJ